MPDPSPHPSAEQILHRHFGLTGFRPLQSRVLAGLEQNQDVLAVLPTGAGKSICFQVPALTRDHPTLVVSPLISLMQDQVAAAVARGIPAAALNSALNPAAQARILDGVAAGSIRLLYTSPERLVRLVSELGARRIRPALLAIDEAHCISEWGADFRPAYRTLGRLRARLRWPQAIALTGSATPSVRDDIRRSLGLGRSGGLCQVLGSFDRRNLWFGVARVRSERERLAILLDTLRFHRALGIVYAATRNVVEELARVIRDAGFRSAPYHAGLTAPARRDILEQFLADRLDVVVATCAFGMGIDKPNVRVVVHWTLPATPEAYYQEAGRAGRDGRAARCLLLYRSGDAILPQRQLEVTFPPEDLAERFWQGKVEPARVPSNIRTSLERLRREVMSSGQPSWNTVRRRRSAALARIDVMDRYARGRECRRRCLLTYFGERLVRCAGCDVCSRHPPRTLPDPVADRRLGRLRLALAHLTSPWGGSPLEPDVLRRLAVDPPVTAAELADVPGVGPVLVERYGATMLAALTCG